jgi:hypothetical protein
MMFHDQSVLPLRNGSFVNVECELSYGVNAGLIVPVSALLMWAFHGGRGGIFYGRGEVRYVLAGNTRCLDHEVGNP